MSSPRSGHWIFLLAAIAGIAVLYLKTLGYGFTDFDDPGYVTGNTLLRELSCTQIALEFSRCVMGNYHPITMLSYSSNLLFGDGAGSFHLANVLLHTANCLLVFVFLRSLLIEARLSAITVLLFSVHPTHVESVAWIADRKDLLLLLFGVACLIAYVRFLRTLDQRWLWGSLALFLLASLSKATAVTLLPTLFLIEWYLGFGSRQKRLVLAKVPFLLVSLLVGIIAVRAQGSIDAFSIAPELSWLERSVLGSSNLLIYFGQQFAPIGLSSFYGYGIREHIPTYYVWVAVALLPAILLCPRVFSKGPVWFGILFFVVNISILLQFIPIGGSMRADRYTYLPGIGSCLALASILDQMLKALRTTRPMENMAVLGYATVLAFVAFARVPVWEKPITVWNDMIQHDPEAYAAYASRGAIAFEEGDIAGALKDEEQALLINPDYPMARRNRGIALLKIGRTTEALSALLPLSPDDAKDTILVDRVIGALYQARRYEEAVDLCTERLTASPSSVNALNQRSRCRAQLGRNDLALEDIDLSLQLRSDYAEVWYFRAFIEVSQGDTGAACASIARSMRWPLKEVAMNRTRSRLLDMCRGR